MSDTIDSLQIEITQDSQQAVKGLDALTASLNRLKTVSRGGVGLTTVRNQLKKLNDVVNTMQNPSVKISQLVSALKPLESIGKTNLNSTLNSLKKLPEITNQLAAIDMGAFATQIEKATAAIKPLADEMNKVAAGFSAFPARIQRLITQNERLVTSNKKLSKSYNVLGFGIKPIYLGLGLLYAGSRRIASVMSDWITESNKYVENLNLFRVSMRGAADAALDYAFKVQEVFRIDPSEWIRYQAVFQNMATGFGIASEKAAIMSKVLTQLGYDLATIFNVDYAIAMRKLESAIAGQPRPMREWGFDMSEATLKLVAMKLGIEENVEKMTQFQKAQLRFVQLLETAKQQGILGNFARELHTPANALRILNQQLLFFRRSLGDLLIPILMKILPYLQAFVVLLTDVIRAIAGLLGFSLPVIDYSNLEGMSDASQGLADGMEEAEGAAKKLHKALMPFDEINLLEKLGGGEGVSPLTDLGIDFSKYDYDFFAQATQNQVDRIVARIRPVFDWLKENLNVILDIVKAIGVAFATWEITSFFLKGFESLQNLIKGGISSLTRIATGITIMVTGISLIFSGAKVIGKGEAELFDYIKAAFGAALGVAGSLLIFGTGPLGWTIGISTVITSFIVGFDIGQKEKITDMIKQVFYEDGTGITISDIAVRFKSVTFELTEDMQGVIKGQEVIDQLEEDINAVVRAIDKIGYAWAAEIIETDKAVGELNNLFNHLKTNTKTILDEIYNNIVNAISGAFGTALIEAGYHVPDVLKMLEEIKNQGEATITAVSKEMEILNTKFSDGAVSVEEYKQEYEKLYKQMLDIISAGSETDDIFANLKRNITDINWEDENQVEKAFASISESVAVSREDVNKYFGGIIQDFEQLKKSTTDPHQRLYIENMISVAEMAREEHLKKIDAYVTELFDFMQQDMIRKSGTVAQSFAENWNSLPWTKKWWAGSQGKYVSTALMNYEKNIMSPILEKMKTTMDEFNIEGSTYAEDAMRAILSHMFDYQITGAGTYVVSFATSLSNDTRLTLEEYGIDAAEWARLAGINLSEGLLLGAEEKLEEDKLKWYEWAWWPWNWFKKQNEIDSPSRLFARGGSYLMEGLLGGMSGWDNDFKEIFKNIINAGIELFNKFIDWLNSKLRFSWDALEVMGKTIVPAGSIQLFTIPHIPKMYALGGFPSTGELFIARETGPELVGSIGGKTAVVNNDQIVEAVAQGVFQAVSMAMRLNKKEGTTGDLVINIDGRTLARMQLPTMDEEAQRMGFTPILRYAE